jgi:hypothetical protein
MDSYAPTDVCIGALAGFRSPGVAISTKKKAGGFDTCARWLPLPRPVNRKFQSLTSITSPSLPTHKSGPAQNQPFDFAKWILTAQTDVCYWDADVQKY